MDNFMQNRNTTISICKGIGIILMVIGHSDCPIRIHDFIYLFHMPLFFIITGFLFKTKYLNEPWIFLKRKLSALYKPFLYSNLIVLGICFISNIAAGEELTYGYYLDRLFKIVLFTGQDPILGALWFLRTLFFSNIIVFILFYIQQKKRLHKLVPLLISFVLLIAGYFIHSHWGQIAYDIQRELMTPILLIMGIYLKQYITKLPQRISLTIPVFLLILVSSRYFTFDLAGSEIYNPIVYIIYSMVGFYLVYTLSAKMQGVKFLAYTGDHSLSILVLYKVAFYTLSVTNISTKYWIIYSLYAIFFPLFLDSIYHKIRNKIWEK